MIKRSESSSLGSNQQTSLSTYLAVSLGRVFGILTKCGIRILLQAITSHLWICFFDCLFICSFNSFGWIILDQYSTTRSVHRCESPKGNQPRKKSIPNMFISFLSALFPLAFDYAFPWVVFFINTSTASQLRMTLSGGKGQAWGGNTKHGIVAWEETWWEVLPSRFWITRARPEGTYPDKDEEYKIPVPCSGLALGPHSEFLLLLLLLSLMYSAMH